MNRRDLLRGVAASTLMLPVPGILRAAAYPSKPVRLIVPYAPGGSSDVIMRAVARHVSAALGQEMPIINVDGAGGAIGWSRAAASAPDGYTLTQLTNAMLVKEATKSATVTVEDFAPVAFFGTVPLAVTAKAGRYADLAAYAEAAKASPGTLSLAMGVGTPAQFVAQQVSEAMGGTLRLVNVGGGAQKIASVLGGHTQALIEPVSSVSAQHAAGELQILAVLSDERMPSLPDVPTAKEQGFDVGAQIFYGFGAPQGTPPEVLDAVASATEAVGRGFGFDRLSPGLVQQDHTASKGVGRQDRCVAGPGGISGRQLAQGAFGQPHCLTGRQRQQAAG